MRSSEPLGILFPPIVMSSRTLSPSYYVHFLLSQRNVPLDVAAFLVFEVFLLGMDNAANTTAWALLFLTLNPVIQEKLYQEIRDWCSDKGCKTVRAEDVSKLQYLQAVLKETLRMTPIAPVVPRMAVNDTTIGGNKIPRGSELLINVYAVHYDSELCLELHQFMPKRFLPSSKPGTKEATKGGTRDDGGGDVLANKVTDKSFLPFGGGMKSCAGMEVGKLQVAFTVANLVNAFRWSPGAAAAGEGQHPTEEHLSFVLMMKNPFAARITPRSHV